jgi:hypothetical protein
MDTKTIATLKTVCTAGRASEGYNGECNAQLEQLAEDGLLTAAGGASPVGPGRSYKPTAKGRELVKKLSEKGAA